MEHNNRFSDSFFQQVGLTEESTDERVLKLFSIFLNRAFNDPAFGIVNLNSDGRDVCINAVRGVAQ